MKSILAPLYEILVAKHAGMCFSVRQAMESTETPLEKGSAIITADDKTRIPFTEDH